MVSCLEDGLEWGHTGFMRIPNYGPILGPWDPVFSNVSGCGLTDLHSSSYNTEVEKGPSEDYYPPYRARVKLPC